MAGDPNKNHSVITRLQPLTAFSTITMNRASSSTESPVSRIPNELLSNIFSNCYEDNSQISFSQENRSQMSDLVLISNVCRHWRNVATGNPRLWAHIELFFEHTRIQENRLKLLTLFLGRSAAQPISVELINYSYCKTSVVCTHQFEALLILLSHAQRWSRVILRIDCAHFEAFCERLELITDRKAFPILRSAEIIPIGQRSTPGSLTVFLKHAPALSELAWLCEGEERIIQPADVDLFSSNPLPAGPEPWSSLTSVSLFKNFEPTTVLAFLMNVPRLENFEIVNMLTKQELDVIYHGAIEHLLVSVPDIPSAMYTVFPALRTIRMCGTYLSLTWLLSRLICPALRSLALGTEIDDVGPRYLEEEEYHYLLGILFGGVMSFVQRCEQAGEKLHQSRSLNGEEPDTMISYGQGTEANGHGLTGLQELSFEDDILSDEQVSACLRYAKNVRCLLIVDGSYHSRHAERVVSNQSA